MPSHPLTFRDPDGRLFRRNDQIFRLVFRSGAKDLNKFLSSKVGKEWLSSGKIVQTKILDSHEAEPLTSDLKRNGKFENFGAGELEEILEHERIPFQSFPYEWPPEMLFHAASLTLDLAESLLEGGFGLKDATPYNVLFRGSNGVFVDLLSFEQRDPCDPVWLPYAQFTRMFLLPLLLNKCFGIRLDQIFIPHRDGIEPEQAYRLCSLGQKFRSPFFPLITLPTKLGKMHNPDDQKLYEKKLLKNSEQARFVTQRLFRGLRKKLTKVSPEDNVKSTWSDYMISNNNYSEDDHNAKKTFVDRVIHELHPKRVLDIGCNTGQFSMIAANNGASVVSIDYDPVVVGATWREVNSKGLDVLPLVADITRPTPSIGWRNQECPSFLERARGSFDCVLMLAVIHHMLVTERIPLQEIVDLVAELTTDILIIEFVSPEDSMFRRLTRGREELYKELNTKIFEEVWGRHFNLIKVEHRPNSHRWLYLWRKIT